MAPGRPRDRCRADGPADRVEAVALSEQTDFLEVRGDVLMDGQNLPAHVARRGSRSGGASSGSRVRPRAPARRAAALAAGLVTGV